MYEGYKTSILRALIYARSSKSRVDGQSASQLLPRGWGGCHRKHAFRRLHLLWAGSKAEPNWDEEMSLFRKRANMPNQLETLRKIEAEVEVGKVLYVGKGVAIVEGLNSDAPIGTQLGFVSGAAGVLLCRHNDIVSFALLLGGQPEKGEGVVCKVKAILQIVDESEGPTTKRDYDIAKVPVGESLIGHCTDFLGRLAGSSGQLGTNNLLPLLNQQVAVDDREQILDALLTGVKAVDVLTPIGRGQAQLVTGLPGSGKTSLVLDAILAQQTSGVHCIYAAVGQSTEAVQRHLQLLSSKGAMKYTSVVTAPAGSRLGEQYAALCAACSRAERIRDAGGHALVVLDDISCMVEMWEHVTEMLAKLGPEVAEPQDDQAAGDADTPEALVMYEGMLVSVAAAQRRGFFSMLVQRAAKMHRRRGGGSMTLLLVLSGVPATGKVQRRPDVASYQHLSVELKAKLEAALSQQSNDDCGPLNRGARTEVVEEFMSMADGQTVTVKSTASSDFGTAPVANEGAAGEAGPGAAQPSGSSPEVVRVDASASVSRIGGRAYPQALRNLAQRTRLDLLQALDADRFSSSKEDHATTTALQRAERLTAALTQAPGHPVPLEEQVAILFALQSSVLSDVAARRIPLWLSIYVQYLWKTRPQTMRNISVTQKLGDGDVEMLQSALEEAFTQFGTL